jgi:hypothetical protein
MSKQYNKAEKRKRRQAYLKRRKTRIKTKTKAGTAAATVAPAGEPKAELAV